MTALILLFGGAMIAQAVALPEADYVLPEIEVRGERWPDATGPLPLAETVLDRRDLARRPGGNLADLLLPIAGLRLASWSGSLAPAISIRGSTTDQVLVLVDGRRLNTAQGQGADLSQVALESVESVEVLRGGASTAWGGDALGGAIHIKTRDARESEARFRVAAGGAQTKNLSGSAAFGVTRDWRARVSAQHYETRGDYAVPEAEIESIQNGDIEQTTASALVQGTVLGQSLARIDASALRSERGVPGSEEFPTPTARLSDEHESVGFHFEFPEAKKLQPLFDGSMFRQSRTYEDPEAALGPVRDEHRNTRAAAEAGLAWKNGPTSLRAFTGFSRDHLRSSTDGNQRRDTAHLRAHFVHDRIVAGRSIRALASARLDRVSDLDSFVSPRFGLQGELIPGSLLLRASAGLAFRPPTFDDLFWPARASAAGNPSLSPETSRDADVGIEITALGGRAQLGVDAFARAVDDLIQWSPGAAGIWRPHNIGRALVAGFEGDARGEFPLFGGWMLQGMGSLTHLASRDETGEPNVDGKELPYRPNWMGSASLIVLRPHAGEIEAMWRFIGDAWVTRANTKLLPGYDLFDLRARAQVLPGVSMDFSLLNVFDQPARDFRDFPLPGRTWELGWTFGGGAS
jgi:outer membrane cobalamin receptor